MVDPKSERNRIEPDGETVIDSVDAAIQIAKRFMTFTGAWRSKRRGRVDQPRWHKLGIWFRGVASREFELDPYAFRDVSEGAGVCDACRATQKGVNGRRQVFDETGLLRHYMLRAQNRRQHRHSSTLDWLTLMQHYGAPTRLMDWSESILVALYFAVNSGGPSCGHGDKIDSGVYVLNARRLNHQTDLRTIQRDPKRGKSDPPRSIGLPDGLNAVFRTEQAAHRGLPTLLESRTVRDAATFDETIPAAKQSTFMETIELMDSLQQAMRKNGAIKEMGVERFLDRLRSPYAIFPNRDNGRLVAQYGMFTIHGGKNFTDQWKGGDERFAPRTLVEINDEVMAKGKGEPILCHFRVPADKRTSIQEELRGLGFHDGNLFPELDKLAGYLRGVWTRPDSPESQKADDEEAPRPRQKRVIRTVADAIQIATRLALPASWGDEKFSPSPWYNLGIWFRGALDSADALEAPVLRQGTKPSDIFDETGLMSHFRLRAAPSHPHRESTLEWLALMQHSGAPTRLLNWTESILVALYFAVKAKLNGKSESPKPAVYALNARRLNRGSDLRGVWRIREGLPLSVGLPEGLNAVFRAELAAHRGLETYFRSPVLQEASGYDPTARGSAQDTPETTRAIISDLAAHASLYIKSEKSTADSETGIASRRFIDRLKRPYAIFPHRDKGRLIAQLGMYTVHGGKLTPPTELGFDGPHFLPEGLMEINGGTTKPNRILVKIPVTGKPDEIMNELMSLGIHDGNLYPEIDKLSDHVRKLWAFQEYQKSEE